MSSFTSYSSIAASKADLPIAGTVMVRNGMEPCSEVTPSHFQPRETRNTPSNIAEFYADPVDDPQYFAMLLECLEGLEVAFEDRLVVCGCELDVGLDAFNKVLE
jgi:hypothetical protein